MSDIYNPGIIRLTSNNGSVVFTPANGTGSVVDLAAAGSGGGVSSVNTLTGAVVFAAGTNITLGTVGNTITINSSGGGGLTSIAAYSTLSNNTNASAVPVATQQFILGTPSYTASGYNFAQWTASVNSYAQISLQNSSSGSSASSDYVVTADDGTDSVHYADFGINNSAGGVAPFTTAHAVYLYSVDSEVDIGALGASGAVKIYTTGGTTPVLAATFDASQKLTIAGALSAAGHTTFEGVTSTGATGTGNLVYSDSPALTTNPTAPTQAIGDNSTKLATTAFVQTAVLTVPGKDAVKYASIAALPSIVYANGASGVGATLTGVALAAISLDGASPGVGDRVLIKNQVSTFQNGIYVVTQTGSGIAVFILTRASDFDQSTDIQLGSEVSVVAGNTLAGSTWEVNSPSSPVMGTDPITFVQVAADLIVGSSTILNGTTTRVLFDNAGILGEYAISGTGSVAMTNSPTLVTPALGTPASGVGTNLTGIPAASILAGTFGSGAYSFGTGNAVTLGTIELGAASDTTLSRVSAGIIAVEGKNVATCATTTETTNTATVIAIGGNFHTHVITALSSNDTFGIPTIAVGSLDATYRLTISITPDATPRILAWNGSGFEASQVALPLITVASTRMDLNFLYNATSTKWRITSWV